MVEREYFAIRGLSLTPSETELLVRLLTADGSRDAEYVISKIDGKLDTIRDNRARMEEQAAGTRR